MAVLRYLWRNLPEKPKALPLREVEEGSADHADVLIHGRRAQLRRSEAPGYLNVEWLEADFNTYELPPEAD